MQASVEVKNTRDIGVKIEIQRNFGTNYWRMENEDYEKIDKDTVKFALELKPRSKTSFGYTVTTYHGSRAK